jgi:transposase InsO family protein
MTGTIDRVEVITSVQRRRRWLAEEKAAIVQETYAPGMSVSLVARRHGIAPNQLFRWRRLYADGALSAVGAGEEVVPASENRALQSQVRELQRLLGKKTLENEILREALDQAQPKKAVARALADAGRYAVKTIADALGVARSNLAVQANAAMPARRRGRPAKPEAELLAEIKQIIVGQPSYGYRRVHALVRRRRREEGGAAVNVKRVYRIRKAYGLLLERRTGTGGERQHDGRVAVDRPDTRWCSDGFEIGCENGERVRIAFTLDCCDREAISWVATTGGIDSGDIRDLMIDSVERRFGLEDRLPMPIEWLSDNGSPYTARETRRLGREIGLRPCTTPIESPQSNGMAETFVKTLKRDYAGSAHVPTRPACYVSSTAGSSTTMPHYNTHLSIPLK